MGFFFNKDATGQKRKDQKSHIRDVKQVFYCLHNFLKENITSVVFITKCLFTRKNSVFHGLFLDVYTSSLVYLKSVNTLERDGILQQALQTAVGFCGKSLQSLQKHLFFSPSLTV